MKIHFKVREQTLWAYGCESPVGGSIDYISCEFEFLTKDWDNAPGRYAVFTLKDTDPAVSYAAVIVNGKIDEDAHINLSDGIWNVNVVGVSESGQRITTCDCPILVDKPSIQLPMFPEIKQDVGEKILAVAGEAKKRVDEAIEKVDNLTEIALTVEDSAQRAAESADAANESAVMAATSEKNAAFSENKAQEYANSAAESLKNAQEAEKYAKISEQKSAVSAENAKNSEDAAKESENAAKASLENVISLEQRATEQAENAAQSAADALASERNAQTSESNAASSASQANNAANAADNDRIEAKGYAEQAGLSQQWAAVSEANARASEANAMVSEANAAESETNAKNSEIEAKAAETAVAEMLQTVTELERSASNNADIAEQAANEALQSAEQAEAFAGKQSDWLQNDEAAKDHVLNRPGGYYADGAINWNGEVSGLDFFTGTDGTTYYRVSDIVIGDDDVIGYSYVSGSGEAHEITRCTVDDDGAMNFGGVIYLIPRDIERTGAFIPHGVYFSKSGEDYVAALNYRETIRIPSRFIANDVTDEDIIRLLAETNILDIVTDENGDILVDENNALYV